MYLLYPLNIEQPQFFCVKPVVFNFFPNILIRISCPQLAPSVSSDWEWVLWLYCWLEFYIWCSSGLWISHVQNSFCKKRDKNKKTTLSFRNLNCLLFYPLKLLWRHHIKYFVTMISQQVNTFKETSTSLIAAIVKRQAKKWTIYSSFSPLSFFFLTQKKVDICQACITKNRYRKKDN